MSDAFLGRRLAGQPDFALGRMTVSPSTGRVAVDGQEIRVEALTLAVLVALAQAEGATVTRDELVALCWQGRIVSDDAIARAIAKVRRLERVTEPAPFTLETVPKIGYRLLGASASTQGRRRIAPAWATRRTAVVGAGALAAAVGLIALAQLAPRPAAQAAAQTPSVVHPLLEAAAPPASGDDFGAVRPVRSADFSDALLVLDEARLRLYLQHGWNPNWKLDSEGNAALHNLMMVCERNRAHDRQGVVRVAELLVRAGADPTAANKWRDTPLIIAATPRYCGPDHPVVAYLKRVIAARAARRAAAGR